MKKTVSITLAGIIFNIEEDGYDKLKNYFDSIKEYFSGENGEILNDIEARAAEKFSEKIKPGKQAINLEDVEELIESMGTVEDISGGEKTETSQPKTETSWREKKLYRDPDNAVILGVAAGIANYLGIDPVFVRLAFIASLFFGGAGILIYIILCFIVPEAKSAAQKIQMHGQPINLANLRDAAEEKIESAKKNFSFAKPIKKIAETLVSAAKKIFGILFTIGGIFIFIGTAIALIGIFFVFGNLLFNVGLPYVNFPEKELFTGIEYYVAIVSGFFVAFIPVLFGLFIGISMIRKRFMLNLAAGLLLLMVWIISISAVGICGTRMFLKYDEKMQAIDKSEKETRSFDVRNFNLIFEKK